MTKVAPRIRRVQSALQSLTYSEMMEVAESLRDMTSDLSATDRKNSAQMAIAINAFAESYGK